MLTGDQESMLYLLRKSFGKYDGEISIQEPQEVIRAILKNGILLTVYQSLPADIQITLKNQYNMALKQSIIQGHEGEQVIKALADAGLNCIALKGWELRKIYSDPTMRQMADLDLLVHPYEFNTIKTTMERMGYRGCSESGWKHDSFTKRETHFEIHKRLTDDSNDIQRWESEIWNRAFQTDTENVYRMCPEDFYIFHFVHLHKDFLNGSLGLRRIADTWLLQRQSIDREATRAVLEGFRMGVFHDRMVRLCKACMGDAPMDDDSEVMLTHALTHGIYGSDKSYKAGRIAAMSSRSLNAGKVNSFMAAVFLPYSRMKAQFPALQRRPFLLPYYWIKRIIHYLKGDLKKRKRILDYSAINDNDYREMKRFFEAGGVRP